MIRTDTCTPGTADDDAGDAGTRARLRIGCKWEESIGVRKIVMKIVFVFQKLYFKFTNYQIYKN